MIPLCAILLTTSVANAVVTVPLFHRPKTLQQRIKESAKHASRAASGNYSKEVKGSQRILDTLDGEYYAEIQIGTPPQKELVLVETRSTHLWVPSVHCGECFVIPGSGAGNYYDHSLSSTWSSSPGGFFTAEFIYNGTYATETVIIAGYTIPNQIFGEVTQRWAEGFAFAPDDGIMGFGPFSQANGVKGPVFNLVDQGKIKHNIIGIFLDSSEGKASSLSFGATEKALYTEDLYYMPVSTCNWMGLCPGWGVIGERVSVGDKDTNYCGEKGCIFEFNTGTAYILAWHGYYFYDMIGNVTKNCSNRHTMPIITSTIHGKDFPVGPDVYVVSAEDPETGEFVCFSYVLQLYYDQPDYDWQSGLPVVNLGDPFLRRYYSVYDNDRQRLALAPAKLNDLHPMDDTFEPSKSSQTDTEMLFM